VRPGLMDQGPPQAAKPPPVRNYNATGSMTSSSSGPPPAPSAHARQVSIDRFAQPVTLSIFSCGLLVCTSTFCGQNRDSFDQLLNQNQALIWIAGRISAGT
jgi:hypothetical protein